MVQRQEMYVLLLSPLEEQQLCGRVTMNMVSVVAGAQTTSTSSRRHEAVRNVLQGDKVRTHLVRTV